MLKNKLRASLFLLLALTLIITAGCGKREEAGNSGAAGGNSPAAAASPSAAPTESAAEDAVPHSDHNPVVTIEMDTGKTIKLELFPDIAPNTVNNFISLIEKGFYDGTIFHRVIPGFMIQGGDPEGNGTGGPGYAIKGEFTANGFPNDLKHKRGILSMARKSEPLDSAGSQFFIMVADAPHLDGQYAAFGNVLEGMETVDEIVNQEIDPNDPMQSTPLNPMAIKKMTVDTKGVDYPEPETIR